MINHLLGMTLCMLKDVEVIHRLDQTQTVKLVFVVSSVAFHNGECKVSGHCYNKEIAVGERLA